MIVFNKLIYIFNDVRRAVLAIQHSPVYQWEMYEPQFLHHHRDLLQLLGVLQQVRLGGRFLCCRLRGLLCDLILHLWLYRLHQHHLHQEPGIPQQYHSNKYRIMRIHHRQGL